MQIIIFRILFLTILACVPVAILIRLIIFFKKLTKKTLDSFLRRFLILIGAMLIGVGAYAGFWGLLLGDQEEAGLSYMISIAWLVLGIGPFLAGYLSSGTRRWLIVSTLTFLFYLFYWIIYIWGLVTRF